jgi:hypothetical protein
MKTTRFLIILIGFGALTLGPGFAGPPSHPALEGAPSQSRAKTTRVRPDSPVGANRGQTAGAKTTAKGHPGPKLPQPFHANGTRGGDGFIPASRTSGNAAQLHQPGNAGFTRQQGARAGLMVNETQNQRRLPLAGLSGAPLSNPVVPHRGPGPALLGGPALSSARNAAVINGTGMKHRL